MIRTNGAFIAFVLTLAQSVRIDSKGIFDMMADKLDETENTQTLAFAQMEQTHRENLAKAER